MAERKFQQEMFAVVVETRDDFDLFLWKFELRKAVRIGAWVMRFLNNSRNSSSKTKRSLNTAEVEKCQMFLVKRARLQGMSHAKLDQDKEQLNLQPSQEGVLECRGRIQGEYPIYLPDSALLGAKIVQRAHVTTLHRGVGLTMASVREKFWIPRRRNLTKRVVIKCSRCKRFQAVAFANPPPAPLPRERTEGNTPFNVIGVDFAGPVKYRDKPKEEKKSLCGVVLLQPNPRSVPGVTAQYGDYGVPQESEAVKCQERMTIKDLFGQRSDVCSCRKVAKESTER